jgi:hypothetical protein
MSRTVRSPRIPILMALCALLAAASPLTAQQPAPSEPTAAATTAAEAAPPVEASADQPAVRSLPASPKQTVNLVFEEARKPLDLKAAAIRSLRDVADYSRASHKASELLADWQRLTVEWREKALASADKVALGEAKTSDADRAIHLYALGEAESQKALQTYGDLLRLSGKPAEQDRLLLERLHTLNEKAKSAALAEVMRPQIRETENRILALAADCAESGEADAAMALYARVYLASSSELQRQAVGQKLYGLYSDLISRLQFRQATRLASWFSRNGEATSLVWRNETLRLARLMLDPPPSCRGSVAVSVSGKSSAEGGVEVPELLCRFFVNQGLADAEVWDLMGRGYQAVGEHGRAIECFWLAVRGRDHDPVLRLRLARCYAALGQLDDGLQAAREAVNLGYPIRWLLDDQELASLRGLPGMEWLASGILF